MENGTFTSIVSTCSDLRCHQLASATTTQRLFESSEKAEPPDPLRSHPEREGGICWPVLSCVPYCICLFQPCLNSQFFTENIKSSFIFEMAAWSNSSRRSTPRHFWGFIASGLGSCSPPLLPLISVDTSVISSPPRFDLSAEFSTF